MTKNIGAAREVVLSDGRSFIIGPKNAEEQSSGQSGGN
jgi:hypothetical protein